MATGLLLIVVIIGAIRYLSFPLLGARHSALGTPPSSLSPDLIPAHGNLAICYVELGQLERAWVEITEVLRTNPNVSLESQRQNMPYKDPVDLERYVDGLRKAGLK
jgi:hypothetical protein